MFFFKINSFYKKYGQNIPFPLVLKKKASAFSTGFAFV